MIRLSFWNTDTGVQAHAEIPAEHGPALRSAIQEHRNELGERSKGSYDFKVEAALTRAISAWGQLAAAINHVIPEEDSDYA